MDARFEVILDASDMAFLIKLLSFIGDLNMIDRGFSKEDCERIKEKINYSKRTEKA